MNIYEREDKGGGQFNLAAIAPRKHELGKLTHYQALQVAKAGGVIHLNTEVTPELVAEVNPDVVIIEMLDQFGAEMIVEIRTLTLHDFRELGIDVMTSTKVLEIAGDSIVVEDKKGERQLIEDVDSIIVAHRCAPL